MAKAKKTAAKKATVKKAEPVVEEVVEEVIEEVIEEEVVEEEEAEMETEEVVEEEVVEEEEVEEEAEEEVEEGDAEEETAEAEEGEEATAEEEETTADGEEKKKKKKPNNYIRTHPDQFGNFLLNELKNDYVKANLSQNMNVNRRRELLQNSKGKKGKKDMARIHQKRAQLCLDAIVAYGKEYRNCSTLALMNASHTFREAIMQHRKNIGFGERENVPENSHHVMMKMDDKVPQHAVRAVLKWMHTGDLQLTAKNFEDVVAVTLFLRIRHIRQMLQKLGRKVGVKFVPVPASARTIERRKKMGKKDLPDGMEEPELEEGEEPLPEDAPVCDGKAVLEKVKEWAKIDYINEIPGSKKSQPKKTPKKNNKNAKQEVEEESASPKKGRNQSQNRKRGHNNKEQKSHDESDAKKARKTPVKQEANNRGNNKQNNNNRQNSRDGNNRGRNNFAQNNRQQNVYRQPQQQYVQPQQFAQPQVQYYQPVYAQPAPQYGMQPAPHMPPPQQPRQQQGYYGGR